MKRKIRVALISCGVCWVLLGALQSSFVGYFIAGVCGIKYYSEWVVAREHLETVGDFPSVFWLNTGGGDAPSRNGTIIPCLLFYDFSPDKKRLLADLTVPRDCGVQRLDLTTLELVLPDGNRESLIPSWSPPRFYFGDHELARRFVNYSAGRLESAIEVSAMHNQGYFFSSFGTSERNVTLIAEGIIYKDSDESLGQPFRQVSEWRVERKRGFRKMGMP